MCLFLIFLEQRKNPLKTYLVADWRTKSDKFHFLSTQIYFRKMVEPTLTISIQMKETKKRNMNLMKIKYS